MSGAPERRSASERVAILTERILSGPSATLVLEEWCRDQALAPDADLLAEPADTPPKAPVPSQCERLAVAAPSLVRYRRVRLTRGGLVLSEAENWYVPGRLTEAMNRVLSTTTVPFGRVVHDMAPSRRTIALDVLWHPESGLPDPMTPLFAVRAVLSDAQGMPFCEVFETYRGALLSPAGDKV